PERAYAHAAVAYMKEDAPAVLAANILADDRDVEPGQGRSGRDDIAFAHVHAATFEELAEHARAANDACTRAPCTEYVHLPEKRLDCRAGELRDIRPVRGIFPARQEYVREPSHGSFAVVKHERHARSQSERGNGRVTGRSREVGD